MKYSAALNNGKALGIIFMAKKLTGYIFVFILVLLTATAASCSGSGKNASVTQESTSGSTEPADTAPESESGSSGTDFDRDTSYSAETADAVISLNGESASVEGGGAAWENGAVVITKAGTYILKGTLSDGKIVVNAPKTDKIRLILEGVTASCSTSAPIYIASADKVSLTLADGTQNIFEDAAAYVYAAGETKPNACIYSSEDLTINGNGSLEVRGNSNNAIGCKNDLKIMSVNGKIVLSAINNALKGNESVTIMGGDITILKSDDGIKSDDEIDAGKGYVYIGGGNITITASDDAIQAVNSVTVKNCSVTVSVGGKTVNCDGLYEIADGCIIEK